MFLKIISSSSHGGIYALYRQANLHSVCSLQVWGLQDTNVHNRCESQTKHTADHRLSKNGNIFDQNYFSAWFLTLF